MDNKKLTEICEEISFALNNEKIKYSEDFYNSLRDLLIEINEIVHTSKFIKEDWTQREFILNLKLYRKCLAQVEFECLDLPKF